MDRKSGIDEDGLAVKSFYFGGADKALIEDLVELAKATRVSTSRLCIAAIGIAMPMFKECLPEMRILRVKIECGNYKEEVEIVP